jgi:hypothetical protein
LSVTHIFRGCSTTFKFRYCYQWFTLKYSS